MKALCAGSFVCDIIAAHLPRIGEPGSLIYAPQGIHLQVGGHAANVSIDLAQLGQDGVAVAGSLGRDLWGDFIADAIKSHGVSFYPQHPEGVGTAKNIALVVEGEDRRFIAELTANTMLTPGHVTETLEETRPSVLYMGTIGGLRYVDEDLANILEKAHSQGCATFVDVIMPAGEDWSHLTPALPHIDILHANEAEVRSLTGIEDPGEAVSPLVEAGVKLCIVTRGPGGLTAATREIRLDLPSFKVGEVDSTGAGDALCAGVIRAYLGDPPSRLDDIPVESLRSMLLTGQAAGAACVTGVGATTAVTWERVESLLVGQGDTVWDGARFL